MAIEKSELYSSLRSRYDAQRGRVDSSQYKDYVLVLLVITSVSGTHTGVPYAPITIPAGASFKDMVNHFTNLIAIFEDKRLDFSRNRAEGDGILGDAYEYLRRHFATEIGKSKGQFYTPAEVSRVMIQILGIRQAKTSPDTTRYDPTCGSSSLLLNVANEAGTPVSLCGQEKDAATNGLARTNMIQHNSSTALITQGNTLMDLKYKGGEALRLFDHVVAKACEIKQGMMQKLPTGKVTLA